VLEVERNDKAVFMKENPADQKAAMPLWAYIFMTMIWYNLQGRAGHLPLLGEK
jgi:hypothetical protein